MYNKQLMLSVCIYMHVYGGLRVCFALHGSFLSLLQSLPVFLQGADGVPHLTTSPPQGAVSQNALRVRFCDKA